MKKHLILTVVMMFLACSFSQTGTDLAGAQTDALDTVQPDLGQDAAAPQDNGTDISHETAAPDIQVDTGMDTPQETATTDSGNDTQVVARTWSKRLNLSAEDYGFSVVTVDDGYVVAGSTNGGNGLKAGMLVVKYDLDGNVLWQNAFGDSKDDSLKAIAPAGDGGFFVTGYYYPADRSDSDMVVMKLDSQGKETWRQLINGDEDDEGWGVTAMADGGCVAVGLSFDAASVTNEARVVRFDKTGKVLWSNTYGGEKHDSARGVVTTTDGGVVVVGSTASFGEGMHDVWLFKLDSNGDSKWAMTFGGAPEDYGYAVAKTRDGGYVIAGATASYSTEIQRDVWLIRVDGQGNKLWDAHFGDTPYEYGYSVVQTQDGGFVVAGSLMDMDKGNMDGILLKSDADGNIQWWRVFDRGGKDGLYGVALSADGGFVVTGYARTKDGNDTDQWVVKTGPDGLDPSPNQ